MKNFRHRKPSVKSALGLTKAEKTIKRKIGYTWLMKPFRWLTNTKRTVKRKAGYYNPIIVIIRNGIPSPLHILPYIKNLIGSITFGKD